MKCIEWQDLETAGLVLSIAKTDKDLEELQRLRFRIFTEDMGAKFPQAIGDRDVDDFDQWCMHFMVRDIETDKIIGTYRILTPESARAAGKYYSESEFDLNPVNSFKPLLVEVGRSCIDSNYRNGPAIMLLWTGLAKVMMAGGYRYMLGCASVSLRDGGVTASAVWRKAQALILKHAETPQINPLQPYPLDLLNSHEPARIPPLIKGYLHLGATICGEPAWDKDFDTADFPILLDLEWLDNRYKRHFGIA